MSDSFLNSEGKIIVLALVQAIHENTAYLSEVDGAIGDGDHGINMNKGFSNCGELIKNKDINLSDSLTALGTVLLDDIGGSMGPLYGSFFLEMAAVSQDKSEIDRLVFGEMLKVGLESIQGLGNAKLGDKTLLDTLIPAFNAYNLALSEDASFKKSLKEMVLAAEKGKESTRDLVAKIGRASRLGERSRGVLDAGAVSCFLILQAFANSINTLLSSKSKEI